MRISLLPSSPAEGARAQVLTSFLIDDSICIDAGSLGYALSTAAQGRVRHVLLSHAHADHLASLPMFIENVSFVRGGGAAIVHGHPDVLDILRRDVFNDRIWPDYFRLAAADGDLLRLEPLTDGRPVRLGGVTITPVEVAHAVPTFGFLLDTGAAAAVIATDTGPTERIWELANRSRHLKTVFLDASFPEAMADLARKSGHMTPGLFVNEMRKVEGPVRFVAVHIKAAHRERVVAELAALDRSELEVGVPGALYRV